MKYRVAIIGCGAIFERHYQSIKHSDNFELVAICDIQKSIVDSLSKRLNVAGFSTFEDCLEHSNANFYVIATPNANHYEQAMACIEKNKHYIVEKPACLKFSKLEKLVHATNSSGVNGYCVLQVRLNESVNADRDWETM